MKPLIFLSSLFAALTSAAPPPPEKGIYIHIRTEHLAERGITFPVQYAVRTPTDESTSLGYELSIAYVEDIPLSEPYVVCAALEDAAGTVLLGRFVRTQSLKISITDRPARVGMIYCADKVGAQWEIDRLISKGGGYKNGGGLKTEWKSRGG